MNTLPVQSAPVNGVVLYSGPSCIDGRPIVAIATNLRRASENRKTGRMVQCYILCRKLHPSEALQTGADRSICGDCPHRRSTCYVDVSKGPAAVWRAYKRGSYAHKWSPRLFAGRAVRLGAYGDPAAVPLGVWERVVRLADRWTGYTHQWRTCPRGFRRLCMASVDTPDERQLARARGWRTFRIRPSTAPLLAGEIVCPASAEAGKRLTCAQCRACSGAKDSLTASSVAIVFHGAPNKVSVYNRLSLL